MSMLRGGMIFLAVLLLLALVATLPTSTMALIASTDKQEYHAGETVVVTGVASDSGVIVSFTVYNPSGALVTLDQTTAGSDKSFTIELFRFPSQPQDNFPEGEYTIVVKDAGSGETLNLKIYFTYALNQTETETETTTQTGAVTETVTTTVTETETKTVTTTVTVTQELTKTKQVTVTKSVTKTKTLPPVTTTSTVTQTETVTSTSTTTVTKEVTNMKVTGGAAIAALVVGLAIALAVARK